MTDTGVIDTFLSTYTNYIDSGFGLLGGEVGFLSSTLIVIDVTLAGLFWAWGENDVLQRLIRKVLMVGTFAWILNNFSNLAAILFQSFAGLGLKASGSGMALADFLKPGTLAGEGLTAAQPLLDATASLLGPVGVFTNLVEIAILLLGWVIVVIAFFILAIQVFVTIIEFKLVTLAGFILVPFAFFGRTAFMAEKVLGHIISSGIKLLVLGVITGIGTGLFSQFTNAGLGSEPTANQVMAMALAALTLMALAMFAPSLANGIVAGGPQLGAGAAAGTALAVGAAALGGVAGARMAVGAAGSAVLGGARALGAAQAAFATGGVGSLASAAGSAATSPLRRAAAAMRAAHGAGRSDAGQKAPGSAAAGEGASGADGGGAPDWALRHKRAMAAREGASILTHTLRGGDSQGGGASVDLDEKESSQ